MKHLYLTTALALIASPALADITPEELWQSWQGFAADFGGTLTAASQAREGDTLVLHNVTIGLNFGFFNIEDTFANMRMTAQSDGTVAVDSTTTYTLTMDISPDASPTAAVHMEGSGSYEGATGVVSGTVDDYIYETTTARFTSSTNTTTGAQDLPGASHASQSMTMKDVTTRLHVVTTPESYAVDSTFTLGQLESTQKTEFAGPESETPGTQTVQTTANGYSGSAKATLPRHADWGGQSSVLPEGLTVDAQLGLESSSMTQTIDSAFTKMNMSAEEGASGMGFTIDGQTVALSASSTGGGTITINAPQMGPAPYSVSIDNADFALSLPYRPSDTPQDAGFRLALEGVTANDTVWAMADPAGSLSHAPADFTLDMRASIGLLLDWTTPDAVKAVQGPPAVLHSIELRDFLIALENAELSGLGEVSFSPQGPVPMPNGGQLNFSLQGVNALLDKLGSLPLLDPALTDGAKGMLGVFTTSTGGPDSLTSQIEFTDGGHVVINGQQVR